MCYHILIELTVHDDEKYAVQIISNLIVSVLSLNSLVLACILSILFRLKVRDVRFFSYLQVYSFCRPQGCHCEKN